MRRADDEQLPGPWWVDEPPVVPGGPQRPGNMVADERPDDAGWAAPGPAGAVPAPGPVAGPPAAGRTDGRAAPGGTNGHAAARPPDGVHDAGDLGPGVHAPGAFAAPEAYGGPGAFGGDDHDEPGPDLRADEAPDAGPGRSRAQIVIPAPEDLPPPEEVFGPGRPRGTGPEPAPDGPAPPARAAVDPVPPAPALDRPVGAPAAGGGARTASPVDRRRLAVVYDIEGPRVRLGVAWFLLAVVATLLPAALPSALVYAAVAGLAARQIVRAWGSVPWHADVAAGIAAVPALAALIDTPAFVVMAVAGLVVAVGCAFAPDGARLPGGEGRIAAAGILCLAVVPALAAASFVAVRRESVAAALVLVVVASAYEAGDYIVGSGSSNPVEGPLAGITTATLVALPLAILQVEPYDAAGVGLLAFAAAACPLGQIVASALLPGAGASAPALRRLDTLLVLAPLWALAGGYF